MVAVAYPLVNGVYHAFASVEIKFDGNIYVGVKAVNYSDSLTPTKVRGTSSEPIGRTRGDYDADGDIELYKQQAHQLLQALGNGYKEKVVNITVTYSENGLDTIVDEIIGARIEKVEQSNSQSPDPTTQKFTLNVMKILMDGLESLVNPLTGQVTQE